MSTASQGKPRRHLRPADERQHGISFTEVIISLGILSLVAIFIVPAILSVLNLTRISAATSAASTFASGQVSGVMATANSNDVDASNTSGASTYTCGTTLQNIAIIANQAFSTGTDKEKSSYVLSEGQANDERLKTLFGPEGGLIYNRAEHPAFVGVRDFGGRAGKLYIEQNVTVSFPGADDPIKNQSIAASTDSENTRSVNSLCAPTVTVEKCNSTTTCSIGWLEYTVTVKLDSADGTELTSQHAVVPVRVGGIS
ncbi:hypothetical protein [Pseudoclavibacter soli]|uniref:hypothetical protein n=1 Tax=Pseudoclavibacter soli TaxID=452623 RepID=UPI0012EC722C|nr:hypothetical protein [Pseudoclavibacter soli]